jgi:nucleotide-binding universal stress UspA family protein
MQRHASRELHAAAQRAEARFGIEVDDWMSLGRPAEEILRMAAEERADMIVLGQGRGALDRLLFGSNAHRVVREATCPVLVVRGIPARPHRAPEPSLELRPRT